MMNISSRMSTQQYSATPAFNGKIKIKTFKKVGDFTSEQLDKFYLFKTRKVFSHYEDHGWEIVYDIVANPQKIKLKELMASTSNNLKKFLKDPFVEQIKKRIDKLKKIVLTIYAGNDGKFIFELKQGKKEFAIPRPRTPYPDSASINSKKFKRLLSCLVADIEQGNRDAKTIGKTLKKLNGVRLKKP